MATINTDIAQKIDIIVREDNTATISLNITDSSGLAFDLTGYTVKFIVQNNSGDDMFSLSNGTSDGITNPADGTGTLDATGKCIIKMEISDTSLIPGTYKHKLILINSGVSTQTWMYGKFKVNKD
tara:strand:+ start:8516 stop:8890 length:375 start_codon:yes stop_codon:yes gene_type:complete